jgi:hypothetical protein
VHLNQKAAMLIAEDIGTKIGSRARAKVGYSIRKKPIKESVKAL